MEYSKYKFLKLQDIGDGIFLLKLNRPEKLNAIDLGEGSFHEELEDVFYNLNNDSRVKAVIIAGEGRAFSAGGDIYYMNEISEKKLKDINWIRTVMREGKRIINNILDLEVPLIAAVNGVATGLGATIALFSDIVIMGKSALIGDTHILVGLVAGDGGAVIWPLLIGVIRAKYYLMTGELISAEEAYKMGLVTMVVPDDKVLETAVEVARKLISKSLYAVIWTKASINKIIKYYVNLVLDASLALEMHTFKTEDHEREVKRFIEERKKKK
jgi:enoyl-CoA hydratase/carnithine racemase